MAQNATVKVITTRPQYCNITFQVGTENINKTFTVFLNYEAMGELRISPAAASEVSLIGFLKEGVNEFSFCINETFVPADEFAGSLDTRQLGAYLQNIEIRKRLS